MNDRLVELYVQRGRLRERIGAQRQALARDLAPLAGALHLGERALALLRRARGWVSAHPASVAAGLLVVLVWRPRRVLRALRRGYGLWRTWRRLQGWWYRFAA